MALVLGIDLSTQSTKAIVVDAETGRVLRHGRAPHPEGTETDPQAWLDAYRQATRGLLDGVEAVAVAGQQHGMVALDAAGAVVRPALLWNDTRSAPQAAALVAASGADWWARNVGSVPVASFTITKLAWLAEHEPHAADRVARVLLPHDWLSWRLAGPDGGPFTDRSDASGTGYFSPTGNRWLPSVLRAAFGGRTPELPAVLGPADRGGLTEDGIPLAAGAGDNAGAALGLGAEHGDVVVSLGTSGTVFASSPHPVADPSGVVAGFCDAAGGFLPLVCTLNAARVLSAAARLLGVELDGLSRLALAATPGAGGLVLLPYLDGERTPNLPAATGALGGLTRSNLTAENLARAAVEGMLCGLAEGVDALRNHGIGVRRVLLIGGAAASPAVREIAPSVFGAPVEVPRAAGQAGEYVALGAARQAAWMLSGAALPQWRLATEDCAEPDLGAGAEVRAAHAAYRRAVYGI